MTYFKSLLINCLVVFFVNHVIPGLEIAYYTKLPHVGGELIFAFGLGFLNSLIFPVLYFFQFSPSHFKIGLISGVVSFGAYSIVNLLPVGIRITTGGAYIWSSLIVWFVSYLTNHLEYKRYLAKIEAKYDKKNKEDEDEDLKK